MDYNPFEIITASSEDSSIITLKRNDATVCKTFSSSGHASNTSTEKISKYLIQYVPETPKCKKGGSLKRVMGQRVLTSTEGLKEKEEKTEGGTRDRTMKEGTRKIRKKKRKQRQMKS